ncbi:tRNA (adenosine(37)-N6)-dimethylallyltransferase MiaA [Thermosynechococcus sp. JY1334]|uniref:tRNA (adenosine(37)-N6)-dimethylallyltransferase MiaA n=1 Tax=unclassified Thermosynechococcus TaxID=2622553 RepID=UPI0026724F64|nr:MULTISPECIES: tRNA (adenosine(37)-N6)-dimethylallyltransferase MiaA [unclassified Thermosynechococcus]MDR7897102.1 tRNA (adenosine(37)-N6)-dimethylallyltransferase MiaA [Thermosynechococcus sp. JY1332]MDR7904500.1 tRNA (adenosine(37)-N6)-dimethylallyltransferase MiaA [Thermosynechococcus sp. JY1334]MDR7992337.1 tRNA (adenosine(37)-N6)-dimethylallyltransferase MiaA [Thermosynechococcus sp. TG252]WKT81614.1 tRNA (adenosine(37)-N6)-dimethylallyltransferase MiaA [Thermosynechococcus sp. PP45]WK
MGDAGLIVIGGATATGKTALAIALAQQLNSVILSADSRQVYRGFDIGTAKPTPAQQQQVPHHLIDICDPRDTLTLAIYQAKAQALIAHYHAQGITPLLVGGTGLYIRSITQGLTMPQVPPQPHLRAQLMALGQQECYQWLQQVDPVAAQRIHAHDHVRTLRALEVYYVTGVPLSQQQRREPPPYPIWYFALPGGDRQQQRARIEERTQQMLAMGWLDEIRQLQAQYGDELPLLDTLGYREMRQYLRGELTLEAAIALTVQHTQQFAKRQRTWFRAEPGIHWLQATTLEEQLAEIQAQLGI